MSRGRRFAHNIAWSLVGQVGSVAVNFFALPRVLRAFGAEAYGVYLLVYVVLNYLSLFQFGAGMATIKYVSEAGAAGEDGALRDALRHSALIHLGGTALAAAALWLGAERLAGFFDIPAYYRVQAVWLLKAAGVGGVFAAGVTWASCAFNGLQRLGWPAALGWLQSTLIPLGLLAVLRLGHGLGAAAALYVAVQGLVFAVGAAALAGAVGARPAGGRKGRLTFRAFARYGFSFWPASLSVVASTQIDKVFVAGVLSMSDLTFYSVPSGVLQRLQTLPSTISHALMPVLSESGRAEGREAALAIYLRTTRVLFALCLPAVGLLFALMPQLLGLWLGADFGVKAAPAARLLVAAQAFALIFHAPNAVAGGLGGGRYASTAAWAQALISLALWPFLIPRWGIVGAAAGALAAQSLPTLFYLDATHRRLLGLGWGRFLRATALPLTAPGAALLAIAWAGRAYAWTWPGFFAVSAVSGLVYLALLWPALPAEDKRAARRWLERA